MTGVRAVILGYHDVASPPGSSGIQTSGARRYKFSEEDFRRHVTAVAAARGEDPATFRRLDDVLTSGSAFALTFDDGGSGAVLAADVLEERGWRAHFFVITGLIGTRGFLDAPSVVQLARRGHVVGSHSHSHPSMMARLTAAELRDEWARSVGVLEDLLGEEVTTASVPGGSTSRLVEGQAAAGIQVLFTSEPTTRVSVHDGHVVLGRYQLYGTDRCGTAAATDLDRPGSEVIMVGSG